MTEKAYPRKVENAGRIAIPKPCMKFMGISVNSMVEILPHGDGTLLIRKHMPCNGVECLLPENLELRERIARLEAGKNLSF